MGTENTFSKYFIEGDVLFGRRRAYLKKAVVAPFSGICSGDITVIRAKDGGILPELLPFVIQNDELFSYAVNKSAGSLSPRVKWSRLKQFEFELPDLVKQTELSDLLWSMEDTKAAYKNLLEQTDDLIEARFIEMFGDINSVNVYPRKQWKKVLEIISGKDHKDVSDPNGKYPVYGSGGLMGRAIDYLCPENTVVIGRKGTIDKPFIVTEKFWNVDTAFGIVPNQQVLHYIYLFWYCKQIDFRSLNRASTLPSTRRADLLKLWINIPPYEEQERFAVFVQQADKSKLELQKSLEELISLQKKIVAENLGSTSEPLN
jgi:type I restriction enzyme S subunit